MEPYRLYSGLVLFMGGLAMMVLGVLYLNTISTCLSSLGESCGNMVIAYLLFGVGIVMIVFGSFFLARGRFTPSKNPYPRQYSRV